MGRRKKITPFHAYETDNKEDKNYIRLTKTLLMHTKFIKLSKSAKVLYVYMRLWAYPNMEFTYPINTAKRIMTKNTFLKSINDLEKGGFIEIVFRNKYSHQMNVYKFSNKWYKEN